MDEALSTANHHITEMKTTCKELQAFDGLLRAKLIDLEGALS